MEGDPKTILVSNRAKAVIFSVLALLLSGIAIEESLTDQERARLAEVVPDTSYMSTSPVAQQIIEEAQNSNEEPAVPEKNDTTGQNSEAATGEITPIVPEREKPTVISTAALEYGEEIVIEKIGVVLPIVKPVTYDINALHDELDEGVVLYPASAPFGTEGQTVLLGHSAPDNWPNIKHDTAFSRIDELAAGDVILIYSNDALYRYAVTRTEIIAKGGDLSGLPPAGNSLVLVTCWPPGRDLNRIVVESILIAAE